MTGRGGGGGGGGGGVVVEVVVVLAAAKDTLMPALKSKTAELDAATVPRCAGGDAASLRGLSGE
jgi:hypothetical protein